ncbi:tail fiber protein [Pseudomonas mandelii PD30]|uniref:Tail fiber protein n=1 Tax=Pseudomonas mandelii PD30 TaxID=1419583 RepID=A0A059KT80_9PSED|nr:pyocin knob domain-containing protein [Pseudomonas mandelii]KDD65298.1 tail fiber protein [Pseudomonas mandelii PD30]
MPWYKAGTVSVVLNSNAVIGTGTAFIANSRVGDAFRGPDGAWYEVTNIASDTALSLSPNYQGATNAAGTYALAPMQGYVKESADALRAIVNTYGAKLAVLGTASAADLTTSATDTTAGRAMKVGCCGIGLTTALVNVDAELASGVYQTASSGGGTYPAGFGNGSVIVSQRNAAPYRGHQILTSDGDGRMWRRANNGAWTSWIELVYAGANSTITSLSGLSTALSVAQGGTGNTTGTAAKLAPSAIVGPVSQASGVPTGAIFETGSNANGRYTKFADGTLICSVTLGVTFQNVSNIGTTWTFPVVPTAITFLAANLTGVLGTTKAVTTVAAFARSATGASLSAFSLGQFAGGDTSGVGMDGFLIGRWF